MHVVIDTPEVVYPYALCQRANAINQLLKEPVLWLFVQLNIWVWCVRIDIQILQVRGPEQYSKITLRHHTETILQEIQVASQLFKEHLGAYLKAYKLYVGQIPILMLYFIIYCYLYAIGSEWVHLFFHIGSYSRTPVTSKQMVMHNCVSIGVPQTRS